MKVIVLVSAGLLLTGCASVVDGTSQEITFYSNPPEATCTLERNGKPLSKVVTPGTVMIKKTKHDIAVSCAKEGYQTSTARMDSKIQDATWGNIILGGGIGWAIDSASGADNKYDKSITLTLIPVAATTAAIGSTAPPAGTENSAAPVDVDTVAAVADYQTDAVETAAPAADDNPAQAPSEPTPTAEPPVASSDNTDATPVSSTVGN